MRRASIISSCLVLTAILNSSLAFAKINVNLQAFYSEEDIIP
jgi:hypothetical protein